MSDTVTVTINRPDAKSAVNAEVAGGIAAAIHDFMDAWIAASLRSSQ